MTLAMGWLLQAGMLLGLISLVRRSVRAWRRTVAKVMLYPGPAALAAWVALQAVPVAVMSVVSGFVLATGGLATLGSVFISVGVIVGFVCTCAIGTLVPNLGVSYERTLP